VIAAFIRGPGDSVRVDLRAAEARLLGDLFHDLLELLTEEEQHGAGADPLAAQLGLGGLGDDTPPARPDDPALARLFPDAYPDDPDATAEFRRYTQPDLSAERRRRAGVALETLDRIKEGGRLVLVPAESTAWLGALNDLRLVLGTRLEITADDQEPGEGFGPDDPRSAYVPVYYYLGYLQETLVEALAG
jgi:Domain of unknown function (DUF2017)